MAADLQTIRHSTSHIMAEAVTKLFPGTKVAIGPAIDDGFYYDFLFTKPLVESDLTLIEKEMRHIINRSVDFKRKEISKADALKMFADEPFKIELIEGLEDGTISIYEQDGFTDLCRGPHVTNSKEIKADSFKLRSLAGAYWRGDETKTMLTRIYAWSFLTKADLDAHIEMIKEAEKRDSRKLGKELDLYSTHEEAGPGLVYWHPRGARFRFLIENWWREEHYKNGYDLLYTPHIGKSWLWEKSGHLGFYKENMYSPMKIDTEDYYAKPMNCPFHIMIYKSSSKSYRDLPLKWAELGTVYRYERSGVLHGLMRVRGFTQDDAHIFCTRSQMEDEILTVLKFSINIWKTLGFTELKAYLATKPKTGFVGEEGQWEDATESLKNAITKEGIEFEIDEGGGAFYGPKIDLKIKDSIKREWQMTTIQFDFNLPERFDMTYIDSDGKAKRPFMIHRALLGSLERFFGVFIEHYAGAFPPWLCPDQVVVIPVAPTFFDFAQDLANKIKQGGIRALANISDARMNAKIRTAQNLKIPYMLIVGQKEADEGLIAIRYLDGRQSEYMSIVAFISLVLKKIDTKEVYA